MVSIGLLSKVILALCIAFGILNLAISAILVYNYSVISQQISSSSFYVNQSIMSVRSMVHNVSMFSNTASSGIQSASQNMTARLSYLNQNISGIAQSFSKESEYFATWNAMGYQSPEDKQAAAAFQSIADQLNGASTTFIPQISQIISDESSGLEVPLSNINSSVSRLNESVSGLSVVLSSALSSLNQEVTFTLLGAAFYFGMQGIIFILAALFIYKSTGGAPTTPTPSQAKGTKLRMCDYCDYENEWDARTCSNCGRKIRR